MTRSKPLQLCVLQASDLAAVLDAAYEAFEAMLCPSSIPLRTRQAARSTTRVQPPARTTPASGHQHEQPEAER
jgi:hypothetical protein